MARPPAIPWGLACELRPPDYEPLRDAVRATKIVRPPQVPRELIEATSDSILTLVCRGIFDARAVTTEHPSGFNGKGDVAGPLCKVKVDGVMGHRREVSIRVRWQD